jgi:hypothetical protein
MRHAHARPVRLSPCHAAGRARGAVAAASAAPLGSVRSAAASVAAAAAWCLRGGRRRGRDLCSGGPSRRRRRRGRRSCGFGRSRKRRWRAVSTALVANHVRAPVRGRTLQGAYCNGQHTSVATSMTESRCCSTGVGAAAGSTTLVCPSCVATGPTDPPVCCGPCRQAPRLRGGAGRPGGVVSAAASSLGLCTGPRAAASAVTYCCHSVKLVVPARSLAGP